MNKSALNPRQLKSNTKLNCRYTSAVSVSEIGAVDIQRHGEVHRPPRVRRHLGDSAPDVNVIRAVAAVVCLAGGISSPVADLVRRTIESDGHIEASFRRHPPPK